MPLPLPGTPHLIGFSPTAINHCSWGGSPTLPPCKTISTSTSDRGSGSRQHHDGPPLSSMMTWCHRRFFSPTPSPAAHPLPQATAHGGSPTWPPTRQYPRLQATACGVDPFCFNRRRGGCCHSLATLLLWQPPMYHDNTVVSNCSPGGCLPQPQ